ncbi:unnamed protein product [Spirodela intermedia]|uniref:Uncharacterized protein n=1 Tax=Spirodela intermedia TaxID=51605 RepID=A0A7I8L0L1_SPIIN|nr:unnamed protein product [Spirodela intermedia]
MEKLSFSSWKIKIILKEFTLRSYTWALKDMPF